MSDPQAVPSPVRHWSALAPIGMSVAALLLALIALHLAAASYHHFVRRDNLIARMWYGAR